MGNCFCCEKIDLPNSHSKQLLAKETPNKGKTQRRKIELVELQRWTIFYVEIEFDSETGKDEAWNKRNCIESAFPLATTILVPKKAEEFFPEKLRILISKNNDNKNKTSKENYCTMDSKLFYQDNPPRVFTNYRGQTENKIRWINNDEFNCLFITLLAHFLTDHS